MPKTELTFTGEIKEVDGFKKLEIKNRAYYLTRIQKAPLGQYRIIIEDSKAKRSNQQNRYYRGIVLPLIAEETGEDDTDALHDFFKEKFLPTKYETVLGEKIKRDKTTTKLNKSEFTEYLLKIERLTGVELPNPCESGYACGKETCSVCGSKEYRVEYPESNGDITAF